MLSVKCLLPVVLLLSLTNAFEMEFEIDDAFERGALPSSVIKAVNNAYELNLKGVKELENDNFDLALSYFDQALEVFFDYSDALNNKGVVYYRKGNVSAAKDIWEEVSVKDPSYSVSSYNLGLLYVHEKQLEAAGRLFTRAIQANPKFVEALVRNGMVELQLGNQENALENLKKAYKMAPKQRDAWLFMAYGELYVKDTTAALSILKKHEDSAEALKMLGTIESMRKNNSKAIDYFKRAVVKSDKSSILIEYASVLYDNGNCKEALKILEQYFLDGKNQNEDAYLIAGIAAKDCGDAEAALKYFEEGSRRFPKDAILQHNLGQMYFQLKMFDKAEKVWGEFSDSIQDPSIMYMRAIAARQNGDISAAGNYIMKALELDDRSEFHDFLGVILHQKQDDGAAEIEFRKALKINPENRSAQLNLALISRKGEDFGAVTEQLEQQLQNCTGDLCTDYAFGLSIVHFHTKNIDKAIQILISVPEKNKDERIFRHLAIYYSKLHQYDNAISVLERARAKLVLEVQTEHELAETYLLAGYFNKAVDQLQSLLSKWKQNPWRLYYQIGYAYMEQNELNKARDYFEKSIKSKHDNIAARGLLAFVHNQLGNAGEARMLWEKNIQDDPSNPALWINMGLSYERESEYDKALGYYQKALILKKGNNELQINIGNAYAGLEKNIDAINAYTLALSTPKKELAAYNIFLIARKLKDKERAEKMFSILGSEFLKSVYTMRVKSEMLLWNKDTIGALTILENLSEKDNADYLTLASVYAAKGNTEKTTGYLKMVPTEAQYIKEIKTIEAQLAFGKGDFDNALQLMKATGDTSFSTQYNIALLSYNAGRFDGALTIVTRLLRNASGNDRADCCRLAGNAAFALKQWKQARQWYLQLSGIEANNSIVQYNLAVASYNLGEIVPAWKYYQRAKNIDATIYNKDIEARYSKTTGSGVSDSITFVDSVDIWYNKAVELHSSGNDTSAEKLYKKVVEKDSVYSLAWNNLGAIYGARGDIDNAESAYWKAIEKRHDIPETYINLINLYIELEEFVKARQWIIKGIGHNPDNEQLPLLRVKIEEAEKIAQAKESGRGE